MKKLLFLSLLAFAACKKTDDTPDLPGPSNTGQNYLACKVNGQPHVYNGHSNYMHPNGVVYLRGLYKIYLNANESGYNDYIGLHIMMPGDSCKPNVDYVLGGETNHSYGEYNNKKGGLTQEYSTATGSGWVRFSRVDTAVAAGTFAFTAYLNGQQGADSVVITDGRFDISSN